MASRVASLAQVLVRVGESSARVPKQAQTAFMAVMSGGAGQEREKSLADLRTYCGQDTMAMVGILRIWEKVSQPRTWQSWPNLEVRHFASG